MNMGDGMNYAPKGKPSPVVKPGEFCFAAAYANHGHIYGMCNGLTEAGGILKYIYDPDRKRAENLQKAFPGAILAESEEQILSDPEIRLVASAAVTSERCAVGLRVMEAGKDYFTDKAPFTTLTQLESARETVRRTGQKYMVYYSERLHSECAVYAGDLIREGAIGSVLQVIGMGPHRLSASSRPGWFFEREKYGGILCDIGSHQIEQYLYYAGVHDAKVEYRLPEPHGKRHDTGARLQGRSALSGSSAAFGQQKITKKAGNKHENDLPLVRREQRFRDPDADPPDSRYDGNHGLSRL